MNREISMGDVVKCDNYGVICCPDDVVKVKERISTRSKTKISYKF